MRPPFDLALIESITAPMVEAGHRVFQTHRYAEDDTAHVSILLDILAPKPDAMILDAGCGIGEVSRLMSEARPDLSFILMNISAYQLSLCPTGEQYLPLVEDCHATTLHDGVIDVVMYSSALCQMDIPIALKEAARVMRNGGTLLVNDMVREGGEPDRMEAMIAARVLPAKELLKLIAAAGFIVEFIETPPYDDTNFQALLAAEGLADLAEGIKPVIIRATKGVLS